MRRNDRAEMSPDCLIVEAEFDTMIKDLDDFRISNGSDQQLMNLKERPWLTFSGS